uniref:transporter substrate-binding domain-containing protein n=1 Tax=Oscillibacter sp. TaxID=1945593 RepID=UPI002D80A647
AVFSTVEEGKLHMSTNAAFPPYEMTTDAGGFEGIDVEVAGAIAEKLGLELVVDDMGFDAALTAVQTGQSDIAMAGITVNPERQEVMDFSDSYATGVQVIIVKEGSSIATVDDLANAEMIGCQKATTGYIYCSDTPENGGYGEEHVTAFDTGALAVMALVNGQVDAVVIDNEPAKSFVAENDGLKILDTEFAVEDYAIGLAKGNTALLEAVNAAMAELKADGTFQGIVDKYITAE